LHSVEVGDRRVPDAVLAPEWDLGGQTPDGRGDRCNDHRMEETPQGVAGEDDDRTGLVQLGQPDLAPTDDDSHERSSG
jgi:hypothetical protein